MEDEYPPYKGMYKKKKYDVDPFYKGHRSWFGMHNLSSYFLAKMKITNANKKYVKAVV
jgi:hypothetical protein